MQITPNNVSFKASEPHAVKNKKLRKIVKESHNLSYEKKITRPLAKAIHRELSRREFELNAHRWVNKTINSGVITGGGMFLAGKLLNDPKLVQTGATIAQVSATTKLFTFIKGMDIAGKFEEHLYKKCLHPREIPIGMRKIYKAAGNNVFGHIITRILR